MGFVGVAADGFEAEHRDDVFVFAFAFLCVNEASHFVGEIEGRFFVCEEDEADGAGGRFSGEMSCECEGGGDT